MAETLNADEIREALAHLDGWKRADKAIAKDIELKDFAAAMRFVHKVADVAERENHHPDIDIRWNQVRLVLSTHSAGGLTATDFRMAAQIDDIAT